MVVLTHGEMVPPLCLPCVAGRQKQHTIKVLFPEAVSALAWLPSHPDGKARGSRKKPCKVKRPVPRNQGGVLDGKPVDAVGRKDVDVWALMKSMEVMHSTVARLQAVQATSDQMATVVGAAVQQVEVVSPPASRLNSTAEAVGPTDMVAPPSHTAVTDGGRQAAWSGAALAPTTVRLPAASTPVTTLTCLIDTIGTARFLDRFLD